MHPRILENVQIRRIYQVSDSTKVPKYAQVHRIYQGIMHQVHREMQIGHLLKPPPKLFLINSEFNQTMFTIFVAKMPCQVMQIFLLLNCSKCLVQVNFRY